MKTYQSSNKLCIDDRKRLTTTQTPWCDVPTWTVPMSTKSTEKLVEHVLISSRRFFSWTTARSSSWITLRQCSSRFLLEHVSWKNSINLSGDSTITKTSTPNRTAVFTALSYKTDDIKSPHQINVFEQPWHCWSWFWATFFLWKRGPYWWIWRRTIEIIISTESLTLRKSFSKLFFNWNKAWMHFLNSKLFFNSKLLFLRIFFETTMFENVWPVFRVVHKQIKL